MGLATSHHAFPLCPAKLIQEWLSSSDSICRQNKSASLNTPSALIGQATEGRKWFSLLPFVNAKRFNFDVCEDVTFQAPSHEKHRNTAGHVYSRYVPQRGGWRRYETQTCPRTWSWQICWRRGLLLTLQKQKKKKEKKKKKHADIWRALKPLTFTALALEPSSSIKRVKRERHLIGEKQRREKQGVEGGQKEEDVGRRRVRERGSGGWIWATNCIWHLEHCWHDNELHTHTDRYSVYMLYWRTGVLHKPVHDYWASLNHTYVSHHHGYNLQ